MADESMLGPDLSLTPGQQNLLRTALSSNRSPPAPPTRSYPTPGSSPKKAGTPSSNSQDIVQTSSPSLQTNTMYESPIQDIPGSGQFGSVGFDESPFLDFEDDGNFDWDNSGDQMFGSLPGEGNEDVGEHHDKRKNPEDEEDDEEGDSKRHEGNDKSAKKPGRKPLNSSEPTTKRKAQNRAAQRAFRERKERHLKELESKVDDLEKASESTNHENGRLRAQVDRLNNELKEYRKRISLGGTGAGRSPQSAAPKSSRNSLNSNSSDFHFAFPKFGDLPGSNFMTNGSLAKVSSPTNESQRYASPNIPGIVRGTSLSSADGKSPTSRNGSSGGSAPYQSPTYGLSGKGFDELNGLFSPSILESASRNNSTDYISFNGGGAITEKVKQGSVDSLSEHKQTTNRDGSSNSITASPSTSSMSHNGLDSSCGTTPEASVDSPDNRKPSEGTLNTINEESSFLSGLTVPSSVMKSPINDVNGIDWMAQQNGGQFDPVLFGDYRDPQDSILNSGFFNDAFLLQDDFGSAFNTGVVASPAPKRDLLHEIEVRQNNDEEEVVPGDKPKPALTCDKLWDRMQASEKVQSGEIDIDDLCSQLKAKAKCTGNGAMIDQNDLDQILGAAPTTQKDILNMFY